MYCAASDRYQFVPPLPNWLLGVAVVILCVGVLVLGVPLRGG